ncbi:putative oligosaccharide translocation protein RFT1 [Triangularia verruculosa]|uniref:Man(5)GlcNAc(2)-PP-dolichol translocation protein RFT1 n=1 Tax=Triangularia verruculosa TaxID=2587418 RepID=A0AAN7AN26_9PEZI|nr:putative oligosaccharide translocation protein RFT1 [Triangularia verruculosa]
MGDPAADASASKPENIATKANTTTSTRVLRGASVLILLQIISRAITFIANQVLLRFLTAQLLGVSTQLEVYYLSVIFFARESLRVAIQRQDSSSFSDTTTTNKSSRQQNNGAQAVVNLGYLAIGLGVPLSFFFGWLYLNSLSTSTLESAPNLIVSLYIYALAAIIELLSEPAFMVMQTRLQFSTRAAAESIATFLRCTITLGSAVYGARHGLSLGVLPFALGQLSYGAGLLLVYLYRGSGLASRENFSLFPKTISSSGQYLHPPTLKLTSSLLSQSVLKHLLTQGDTFLVSILSSPTSQGVYALANNYGGLLARLVFQPIEESSRSYFSRLLSSSSEKQSTKPEVTAYQSLCSLVKSYLFLSLIIISLAPVAAPLLLSLIAGPQWLTSGAGTTLSLYTYYIPLLAINGITEAFVSSVATESEVHRQSAWMAAFSFIFAWAGFITLKVLDMGAPGLVWANGVNMTCRILWCWWFITAWFSKRSVKVDLADVTPSGLGVGAAVVAGSVVRRLAIGTAGVKEVLMGLGKIAGVAVVFLGILAFSERRFFISAFQAIKGRRQG